jgi:hypothetical protein
VPAFAVHRREAASQHPPFKQTLPSQQGCVEPPQVPQFPPVGLHDVPACVQKSLALPTPRGLPGQQFCPEEPQVPAAPPPQRGALALQVPRMPPQAPFGATHLPATQQPVPQLFRAQHGSVAAPQATIAPALHTVVALGPSPLARHVPPLQHPPPAQVFPAQQAWPGPPQGKHVPAVQTFEPVQTLAAQHGWLVAPHVTQVVPVQTVPALQMGPAQQAWVATPHTTHVVPLHTPPAAHVFPAQHVMPTAPHGPWPASASRAA